jgi:hypothetical protein
VLFIVEAEPCQEQKDVRRGACMERYYLVGEELGYLVELGGDLEEVGQVLGQVVLRQLAEKVFWLWFGLFLFFLVWLLLSQLFVRLTFNLPFCLLLLKLKSFLLFALL